MLSHSCFFLLTEIKLNCVEYYGGLLKKDNKKINNNKSGASKIQKYF